MEEKKNNLWKGLSELDTIEETRPLSDEEKLEKDWLKSELKKTNLLEEICWRQKSRTLCLTEGD